ncbi:phosphatase PAP2 family protein [Legionella taurinensis]|uniref:phosphatase PAP2 family protein n=1 Tax=Legionella taurinensis TaxID=70611 RepID=UPI00299DA032|nr:phosphatase PAP2 family protein [Legionella taurinensis]MDX1837293.1 phosphatase PAP2 family protein [Legionella taurinensis]
MTNNRVLFIVLVVGLGLVVGYFFWVTKTHPVLPTYFNYTKEEQASLSGFETKQSITESSLKKWDSLMFELIKSNKLGDAPASRIYAYVYTAQRDAAFLSYNVKQQFAGNLDVVSGDVLCLFFPNDCSKIKFQVKSDPYSSQLSKLVLSKINERIAQDTSGEKPSTQPSGGGYWLGTKPYFGQSVGSWKPWAITSVKPFLPIKPPATGAQAWQAQLKETETALNSITPAQTKAVVFWAGNPSTITPPGIWLKFANDYMEKEQLPLPKMVFVRSVLAMGIADSVITIFAAKYTYWIKRPFMLNPGLHTVMPTPNHPSYPAGHSGISATAATILTYYFPQNKSDWWEKAREASSSRIWGGIHFPIDAQEGLILGEKVANTVINSQPKILDAK